MTTSEPRTPTRSAELNASLAVLGLRHDADLDAARAARRALLKRWHPDRFPSGTPDWRHATAQSQRINEAFREVERGLALGPGPLAGWDTRGGPYSAFTESGGLPLGFRDLAWRLRAGERPLDLRNEIVAHERVPKVTAARRVENVQRALRTAQAGIASGSLSLLVPAVMVTADLWGPLMGAYWTLFALAQLVPAGLVLRSARPPSAL